MSTCQDELIPLLSVSIVTDAECHSSGVCYWLRSGSFNRDEANTACQAEGGELATIETDDLRSFVRDRFTYR